MGKNIGFAFLTGLASFLAKKKILHLFPTARQANFRAFWELTGAMATYRMTKHFFHFLMQKGLQSQFQVSHHARFFQYFDILSLGPW